MVKRKPLNSNVIRMRNLGHRINHKRRKNDLTLEMAARVSGVSAPTLSRLERQRFKETNDIIMPDITTLSALSKWLNIPVENFLDQIEENETASTLEKIEAHLRADRNLDPEVADALGRIFRLAYEQAANTTQSKETPSNEDT